MDSNSSPHSGPKGALGKSPLLALFQKPDRILENSSKTSSGHKVRTEPPHPSHKKAQPKTVPQVPTTSTPAWTALLFGHLDSILFQSQELQRCRQGCPGLLSSHCRNRELRGKLPHPAIKQSPSKNCPWGQRDGREESMLGLSIPNSLAIESSPSTDTFHVGT